MTEQFIQERRYLLGVSPRTIIWYQCSFKAFEGAMDTKEAVRQRILDLRQRGVSTIAISSYLRSVNALHGGAAERAWSLRSACRSASA